MKCNKTSQYNFLFWVAQKKCCWKLCQKLGIPLHHHPWPIFGERLQISTKKKIYNYISFSVIKLGCKCLLQFKENLGFFNFTKLNSFTTKSTLRQFIIKIVSHWELRTVKLLHSCQRQFFWVRWTITHHLSHISKPSIACWLIRVSSQKWAEENCVKEKKPEMMS